MTLFLDPWYASGWSDTTGEPDRRWLSPREARVAYEARGGPYLWVIDGSYPVGERAVRARWRIELGPGRVQVGWLDEHGSVLRESRYDRIDGRLFRVRVADWVYADDRRRWLMYQALLTRTLSIDPDGTTTVIHRRPGDPGFERDVVTIDDPSALWMDVPEFGRWEGLLNPEHGLPEDPLTDPRLVDEWGLPPRQSASLGVR